MAPAQLSADLGPSSKVYINPKVEEGLDDVAVNISEITRNDDVRMLKADDPDATEYSSSFGDTASANENCSGLSDAEVESQFYDDNEFTSAFDGFTNVFPMRKKKLTNHWRNFIRPLMWRCKWAELRIKEMGSQALKYNREIAARNRRKKMEFDQHKNEGRGSRNFPFNFQRHRRMVLKRRKRRRVEYSTDAKVLMLSSHNLFSYSEIKKCEADGGFTADDFGKTEEKTTAIKNSEVRIISTDVKEDNNFLERIFRKMEIVHGRVQKLKGQLKIVMAKNVVKFSSSENLSHLVSCDASVRSPTFSACNGDNNNNNNQNYNNNIDSILDYDKGDLVMPESAVSSYGEANLAPDIIESTLGHLSSADVTQHIQSQIRDSTENIVDNISTIHNEITEAEKKIPLADERLPEAQKSSQEETANPGEEQSSLKSCLVTEFHFPKIKRKRGERKAGGASVWSRQCPATEHDSQ